jgi:hypothetical protein
MYGALVEELQTHSTEWLEWDWGRLDWLALAVLTGSASRVLASTAK